MCSCWSDWPSCIDARRANAVLVNFFHVLKDTGVPVTPRELLDLLEAMEQRLAFGDMDDFYSLSRAILVKDEKYYDRFDRALVFTFRTWKPSTM